MLRAAIKILLFGVAVAGLMLAVRLLLVEPDAVATGCVSNAAQWHCRLRDLVVLGFVFKVYGGLSIATALLAWYTRRDAFAYLAMVAGIAGATLYDFDLAALGLLAGALWLMRSATRSGKSPRTQQAETEQRA